MKKTFAFLFILSIVLISYFSLDEKTMKCGEAIKIGQDIEIEASKHEDDKNHTATLEFLINAKKKYEEAIPVCKDTMINDEPAARITKIDTKIIETKKLIK